MQMNNNVLQLAFKRAALYGVLTGSLWLSGCATVQDPEPESCMGGSRVSVIGFGFGVKKFDAECGKYQLEKLNREANLSRAATLLANKEDPVAQAMGTAIYDALDPASRKIIEERVQAALQAQPARTITKCIRTVTKGEVILDCPVADKKPSTAPALTPQ